MKPYAVVQLRQDNKLGTLFNMVGFQTKLKHGEQVRIFRTIPGLEKAEFARLGGAAPQHLPQFAEAARRDAAAQARCRACALPARSPAAKAMWNPPRSACSPAASPPPSGSASRSSLPPPTTAHGALLGHITGGHIETIDAGPALVPADERQFRPVPAADAHADARARSGERLRGTGQDASRRSARSSRRALADLDRWIAGEHSGGGRVMSADSMQPRRAHDEHDAAPRRARRALAAQRRAQARHLLDRGARHFSRPGRRGRRGAAADRPGAVVDASRSRAISSRARRARSRSSGRSASRRRCYFAGKRVLVRRWIDGVPLHIARPLGDRAYFRSARRRLRKLHRAGFCHNDLAKEQNWLRGTDGRAYLTDFQLSARLAGAAACSASPPTRTCATSSSTSAATCRKRSPPTERRMLARKSVITRVWQMPARCSLRSAALAERK